MGNTTKKGLAFQPKVKLIIVVVSFLSLFPLCPVKGIDFYTVSICIYVSIATVCLR